MRNPFDMLARRLFGSSLIDRTVKMIAADRLDDEGDVNASIVAAWLRLGLATPVADNYGGGDGYGGGRGGGRGSCRGSGRGSGCGRGDGSGYGSGYGGGDGYGDGGGSGYGRGGGGGDGYGYGSGYGGGYGGGGGDGGGYGGGYGYGGGRGDGSGYGRGDGSGGGVKKTQSSGGDMIRCGDYVCVRSSDQGVVYGVLESVSGRECDLLESRQQYDWSQGALTLQDVILQHPKDTGLRLSRTNPEGGRMTEICGIWKVPANLIEAFKTWPHAEV